MYLRGFGGVYSDHRKTNSGEVVLSAVTAFYQQSVSLREKLDEEHTDLLRKNLLDKHSGFLFKGTKISPKLVCMEYQRDFGTSKHCYFAKSLYCVFITVDFITKTIFIIHDFNLWRYIMSLETVFYYSGL